MKKTKEEVNDEGIIKGNRYAIKSISLFRIALGTEIDYSKRKEWSKSNRGKEGNSVEGD